MLASPWPANVPATITTGSFVTAPAGDATAPTAPSPATEHTETKTVAKIRRTCRTVPPVAGSTPQVRRPHGTAGDRTRQGPIEVVDGVTAHVPQTSRTAGVAAWIALPTASDETCSC